MADTPKRYADYTKDDLMYLLETLTPGGSEFHQEPQTCARWLQERRGEARDAILKKKAAERERDEALASRDTLARRVQALDAERGDGSGWVSVGERLPDHGGDVLVCLPWQSGPDVLIGQWDGETWYSPAYDLLDTLYRRGYLTHWRELPDAPQPQEEEDPSDA